MTICSNSKTHLGQGTENETVTKIISVDFQKEFVSPEGQWFNPGKSVDFIKETLGFNVDSWGKFWN